MRKFILPVTLASLTLGCSTALPPERPVPTSPFAFAANERLAVDYVYILTDGSGTMWAEKTFPAAKAQTQAFVAAMPEGDYSAAAVGFGGDDRAVAPLLRFDRAELVAEADALSVMGALDGRGGLTPLHDVFGEVAASLEGRAGDVAIVLFSDGQPDQPELAMATAAILTETQPGGVCFHSVQAGSDPEGEAFLRGLAALDDCGSFRTGGDLETPSQFSVFSRQVFAGELPPVGAGDPCTGNLRLPDVEFEFDRDRLTPESEQILGRAASRLAECEMMPIQVDGYTDSVGAPEYNLGLSERRAESARRFLIQQGIEPDRLTTRGFGSNDPLAPNDTPEGRAANRRVELHPR